MTQPSNNNAGIDYEPEMDYETYAPHYDRMCDINPAYMELNEFLKETLLTLELGVSPRVVDLGAGTGNFVCTLLDSIPDADVLHVDSSREMNGIAKEKYARNGYKVEIQDVFMQEAEIPDHSIDLLICVNALNNAPPPEPMLGKIASWLKPGGHLFLVDFGREINVLDWTWYMAKYAFSIERFDKALINFLRTIRAASVNRTGKGGQSSGTLWTHTSTELDNLIESAGLTIQKSQVCYRGYADLVVAMA